MPSPSSTRNRTPPAPPFSTNSRGWCLLQRGRDDDALDAYEQAIHLVPIEPPTAARARVLAASADALERVDRPQQAAERAADAVAVAIAARSPGDEGHARHTLGVALASTGDLAGGLAELPARSTSPSAAATSPTPPASTATSGASSSPRAAPPAS